MALKQRSLARRPFARTPRGAFASDAALLASSQYRWTRGDTVSTAIIAVLALITRFIKLGAITDHGTPIFDEKHYVPQAYDIYESTDNLLIGGSELNPGFGLVVHPPLAKQVTAIGEAIFGYTPLGWRVMNALIGVAVVLLIMALCRRLTRSPFAATVAGLLAVFDGVLLVTSRFGMLDIVQVACIVAAAYFLVLDHQQQNRAVAAAWAKQVPMSRYGYRIGFRWWRFACGISLGLALSVKWSGLYYMAFFGLLAVGLDAFRRHRLGAKRPILGALGLDAFPAFASLVIVPVGVYLASWRAWFSSETAVYRHALRDGTIAADSALQWLPESIAGFVHYHVSVLEFHSTLTNSEGHHHPWESKPFDWLVAARPLLYFSSTDQRCAGTTCQQMLFLFGTPAIWWMTIPIVVWAAYSVIIRKHYSYGIPLVAFLAGFLPWLINYDRQMYFFYATALVPFSICMLAICCDELAQPHQGWLGRAKRVRFAPAWWNRLSNGRRIVVCYLALVLAMFFYFLPILYGFLIPSSWFDQLIWLPSWY
ncbi:dolichyl-phosphate-mannose--protein mannosyltransferase [Corynebacterium pelargi]|uniref:Polyprenol-phosphate-mannose--protein mannosyltransferase n=1 Tax=Corynebacterium pelargi TaxID=1471400 RepID=A0A410W9Z0_9CORY|nr:phospholipid carrier-dependent glycosyltransferase [Corynebacterium pelargi]QAU52765.1 putative dolichyl-phosphate-mannose--protein mannosyltransferase [Corynebacterium pelargi]GGG78627.1 putative dolichyl-phosphate-mannose--protein mannosyltransferase [Corynebacterium pelargi]